MNLHWNPGGNLCEYASSGSGAFVMGKIRDHAASDTKKVGVSVTIFKRVET